MRKLIFIGLLMFWVGGLAPKTLAQVASLTPHEPEVGQIVTITYNPKAPGAKLTPDKEIYAIGDIYFPERKSVVFKMRKEGDVFEHEFTVPDDLSYISFSFRSVKARDTEAAVETMIYHADGKPVRNAYLSKLISKHTHPFSYREMVVNELALYPDNYAAYVFKWDSYNSPYRQYAFFDQPSIDDLLVMVKDWEVIEQQAEPQTAEYQYVRAMS